MKARPQTTDPLRLGDWYADRASRFALTGDYVRAIDASNKAAMCATIAGNDLAATRLNAQTARFWQYVVGRLALAA